MQSMHHTKLVIVFVVLCGLSFLVAWDVHTLRRHSPYDEEVAEVRRYSGEEGVFRVLFSRLRDANEANTLLAARSNLLDLRYARKSETKTNDAGRRAGAPFLDEKKTKLSERATMLFRPLTPTSPDGINVAEKVEQSPRKAAHDDEDESSPMLIGLHGQIGAASDGTSEEASKEPPSHNPDYKARPEPPINHLRHQALNTKLEAILNSTHSISDSRRQRTAVEAIKTLLLYNETDSARALWVMAQQQQQLSQKSTDDHLLGQSKAPHSENGRRREDLFRVLSHMSWPVPQFTRSDVLQSRWVQELKQYLEDITTWRQVSVVTANQEHQEVVLNWLVSAVTVAKLPLRNILVLSLSIQLHDLLTTKKVNSVYISPADIISHAGLKRITTAFNQIHIVRLTLFRLMTHWKYNVVMYDSDAVVLKDPQPIFDNYPGVELIGSAGKGPESIGHVWGRTICTGVLLMRSSPGLEAWWEKMSKVAHLPFTDQGLVNLALKSLHVRWDQPSPLKVDRDMRGSCPDAQIQAVVLSEEKICRYSCESHKRGQYYVWHKPAIKRKRTVENKKKRAREGGAWLLRDDWAEVSKMNSLTGVTWLLAISHNT